MAEKGSYSNNSRVLSEMVMFQQLYDEALQKNEEGQKHWVKLKDDYELLECQLSDLPTDLTKDVMVPVGPRALMKGKIVHTNEILVCLGEGWFAKRSATQASEICKRRLTLCKETLSVLEKEKVLLTSRKELPLEEEAFKEQEIIEVCTEEELEQWRAEHQHKEKVYRKQLVELRNKEKTTIDSDEALWKRLDELELQEELEDELNRLHGDDDDDDDDDSDGDENNSDASDNEIENQENRVSFDAYFANSDFHGEKRLVRRKVVTWDSGKAMSPERLVSLPDQLSKEDGGMSTQIMASNSGRRVSFADLPPEEIPDVPKTDIKKSNADLQTTGSSKLVLVSESVSCNKQNPHSDPNTNPSCKIQESNHISTVSPKSILKIKTGDPSTIYSHELNISATDEDDDDMGSECNPIALPSPVTSEVLEHVTEKLESTDSTTDRPMSRFRAARTKKR